jgi:hypothetical protein
MLSCAGSLQCHPARACCLPIMSTPSRNDPCPCGSGKKYKKCCMSKTAEFQKFVIQTAKPGNLEFDPVSTAASSELLMKVIALHQAGRLE